MNSAAITSNVKPTTSTPEQKTVIINAGTKNERIEFFYTWGKFKSKNWATVGPSKAAATKHMKRGLSAHLHN